MHDVLCPRVSFLVLVLAAAGCASTPYQPPRSPASDETVPPDVEYWRGSFKGVGGVQLFEQYWRPAQGMRAGVVLVHGLKDHSSRYRDLAVTLANRGIAVYTFDLRGHGYSEGVRDHITSVDDVVQDLGSLVKRVLDRQQDKPTFLVGQGMGAALVALYAERVQPKVAGVVLAAPFLQDEVKGSERFGTRLAAIFGPRTEGFELDLGKWSTDQRVVRDLRSDPLIHDGQPTAATAGEVLRASDEVLEKSPRLALPALVVWGTADQIINQKAAQSLTEKMGSQDKTVKQYEGLGHDLFHEPDRSAVITDVINWIDTHGGKS